jgi:hypothetical protein
MTLMHVDAQLPSSEAIGFERHPALRLDVEGPTAVERTLDWV